VPEYCSIYFHFFCCCFKFRRKIVDNSYNLQIDLFWIVTNSDVTLTHHNGRWRWILNQLSATKISENSYRLDGRKGAFFQVRGPVQGPREEVQGPCARATISLNRNGCKGHLDMCKGHKRRCKGLWCVQGPHILSLYQNTNLMQGPLMCARASSFAF
jgi:hypothetical protein